MLVRVPVVWLGLLLVVMPAKVLLAQNFPIKLVDDSGVEVIVPNSPQRIVSLALYAEEILQPLVEAKRIAAVSQFAADPGISNVAAWASQIKVRLPLAVEPVLALRPDLVLVAQWSDDGKVRQLRLAGVPVFVLRSPRSFAEVKQVIQTIGGLCGEPARSGVLIAQIDQRLSAIDRRLAAIPPNRRPSLLEYNTWGTGSGSSTSWNSIILRSGFSNPLIKFKQDEWGQVPLSKELLLSLNPDYLVVVDWVYGETDGPGKMVHDLQTDPALATLRAVRAGRVLRVPARLKEATSQYMVDAADYLLAEAERFAKQR